MSNMVSGHGLSVVENASYQTAKPSTQRIWAENIAKYSLRQYSGTLHIDVRWSKSELVTVSLSAKQVELLEVAVHDGVGVQAKPFFQNCGVGAAEVVVGA